MSKKEPSPHKSGQGYEEESLTTNYTANRGKFEHGTPSTPGSKTNSTTAQPDSPANEEQRFTELALNRTGENNNGQQAATNVIQFKEDDKDILVKWPEVPGTSSYKITINSGKKDVIQHATVSEYRIKKNDYDLKNGKTFRIDIDALQQETVINHCDSHYTVASKTLLPPKNVQCSLDPANPSRRITATWEAPVPSSETIKGYECGLYSKPKLKSLLDLHSVQGTADVFPCLKSETMHYIGVRAVYMNDKKTEPVFSEAVTTEKVSREEVNMEVIGKPRIVSCHGKCSGEKVFSDFSWELPDLRRESNNFFREDVIAAMRKEGEDWISLQTEGQSRTKPEELRWGKKYSLRVTCKYRDLDTKDITNAESTRDFETPIQQLKNLLVSWKKENVTMKWSAAEGATGYRVKVFGEDKENTIVNETVARTSAQFPMTELCRYGLRCKFLVEAEVKGTKKSEVSEEVLIGGDLAVTGVNLQRDVNNPARQLNASWQAPVRPPHVYRLKLFEGHMEGPGRYKWSKTAVFPTKNTRFSFMELKSQTAYYFQVAPDYTTGKGAHDELASHSNVEVTEQRLVDPREKTEGFGKICFPK